MTPENLGLPQGFFQSESKILLDFLQVCYKNTKKRTRHF